MMKKIISVVFLILFTISGCGEIAYTSSQSPIHSIKSQPSNMWLSTVKLSSFSDYCYGVPVVEAENTLFYYVTGNGISKVNTNTNISNIVITNPEIKLLYLNGEALYYNTESSIFKVDLSTVTSSLVWNKNELDSKKYWFSDYSISDFFVTNNMLYVELGGFSMISVDLVTKKETLVFDDYHSFAVMNDLFYFTDAKQKTFSIYCLNPKNNSIVKKRGDDIDSVDPSKVRYDKVASLDNTIYYSKRDECALYQYDECGADKLIVEYNIQDSYIDIRQCFSDRFYYMVCRNGFDEIYEYSKTGNRKVLTTESISAWFVSGDSLFVSSDDGTLTMTALNA